MTTLFASKSKFSVLEDNLREVYVYVFGGAHLVLLFLGLDSKRPLPLPLLPCPLMYTILGSTHSKLLLFSDCFSVFPSQELCLLTPACNHYHHTCILRDILQSCVPFLNAFIELFLSSRLFCRMSCCTCKTA